MTKSVLKRTKLHHLKKFSGHVPEPPNFVTCKIPNREKYSCPPLSNPGYAPVLPFPGTTITFPYVDYRDLVLTSLEQEDFSQL